MAILLDSGASALVHEGTVKRTPLHAAGECGVGGVCVCVCVCVCVVWVWWVVGVSVGVLDGGWHMAVYNFIYLLCCCCVCCEVV